MCADRALPPLRLCAAGYLERAERPYLEDIQRQLGAVGCGDRFEYVGEPDPRERSPSCNPWTSSVCPAFRESKGISLLEAWACGVPAVLPDHGVFTEMAAETGGGLLYPPGDVRSWPRPCGG